jgi:thiosulfate reductase cytochrome b subunit
LYRYNAAYLGMAAMYASVMFGVVHIVFFRKGGGVQVA